MAAVRFALVFGEPLMFGNVFDNRPALSPLEALDVSFLNLSRGIRPVVLPVSLVGDRPATGVVPVDQVRARLAHPSCRPEVRERVWSEVAFRAQRDGEPWSTVVLGFAVPGLRRTLSRLPRLPEVERGELEQEVLSAVVAELAEVGAGDPLLARRLIQAADRVAHRVVYRARRERTLRAQLPEVPTAAVAASSSADLVDEYTVLWRAVQQGLLDADSADLIARTRLEGEHVARLAAERKVSERQLLRRRSAAEQILLDALRREVL